VWCIGPVFNGTAELRKLGKKAKEWLSDRVQSSQAIYGQTIPRRYKGGRKSYSKGKYGRFLIILFADDETISLNQQLVDLGLAKPYYGGKRV